MSSAAKYPRSIRPRFFGFDPWLTIAVVGLCFSSILTIKSATINDIPGRPYYFAERQLLYVVVGLLLMVLVARFDYSRLRNHKRVIYGALIGSILLVFALATASRGSKRWLELPFFRFQPSEFGKLLLILALAAFIADRMRRGSISDFTWRALAIGLIPALLVMAQPDLGTSLVYGVGVLALLFFAGVPWRQFLGIALAVLACGAFTFYGGPAIGVHVLKPYQMDRLTSFLHPSDSQSKEGYQQQQSKIAIGSGEKMGRGEEDATQTALNFLPERHTDFVFGVVGETYGFAGAAAILSLYALLIWRSLRILTLAKNIYGALIVGGITAMLLYQLFVNVGMTMGIMPITGITAPLLSFGGSSMIVSLIAIGLIQAVNVRSRDLAPIGGQAATI